MTVVELITSLYEAGIRLELNVGELRARARSGRLDPARLAQIKERKSEIVSYLWERQTGAAAKATEAGAIGDGEPVEASPQQRQLFFLDQMGQGRAYTLVRALRFAGAIDPQRLLAALCDLIDAHPALRTVFSQRDGTIFQTSITRSPGAVELIEDAAGSSPQDALDRFARCAFDLAAGPLFRAAILYGGESCVLAIAAHHIIVDGLSIDLLIDELSRRYRGEPVSAPPLSYLDYCARRNDEESQARQRAASAFWTTYLQGVTRRDLALAGTVSLDEAQAAAGHVHSLLDDARAAAFRRLVDAHGTTPYHAFLALMNVLLARYTDAEDVCIGTAVANRPAAAWWNVVGFFASALPVRTRVSRRLPFSTILERSRDSALAAFEHQEISADDIIQVCRQVGDLDHRLPFEVVYAYEDRRRQSPTFGDGAVIDISPDPAFAKFNLALRVQDGGDRIVCTWEYRTDAFDAAFVERLAENFATLIDAAVGAPETAVAELRLFGAREQALVQQSLRIEDVPYPRDATVPALIAAVSAERPDAVALRWRERALTYRELDGRADTLAQKLVAGGVRPRDRVGIAVPRSFEQIIGLLAILKAGAAYVPLDLALPLARLAAMCEDVGLAWCLTASPQADAVRRLGLRPLLVEHGETEEAPAPAVAVAATDCAYVLFSSGSTGRPKGIACHHRGIVRLAYDERFTRFDAATVSLVAASLSFDAATHEIWPALLRGGTCVLYPDPALEAPTLRALVRRDRVNSAFVTPALFSTLVDMDPGCFEGVEQMAIGGDVLPVEAVQRVYDVNGRITIFNGYGPTENTVFSTFHRVPRLTGGAQRRRRMPIGRPLSHGAVFVADGDGNPVPFGMPGELCMFGDGVALGYVADLALDASRFVSHPLTQGRSRLYRSGDLGRYLANGDIEFLGRRDLQVKINGIRIELEEIAVALSSCAGVRQAIARAVPDGFGGKLIAAYYLPMNGAIAPETLTRQLGERLPAYMMPRRFVALDAFPLNASGKIDDRRLPLPERADGGGRDYVAPATPTEATLAAIWSDVLDVELIGRDDTFFALGGHSLLALRIIGRINHRFRIALNVRQFLQAATIRRLAAIVDASEQGTGLAPVVRVENRPERVEVSSAQRSLWLVQKTNPESAAYNVPMAWRIVGPLDVARMAHCIDTLLERHEALRTVFVEDGGTVYQRVLPARSHCLEVADAEASAVAETLRAEATRAFDLASGPTFRARLLRLGEREHVLVLNIHHIVVDGWSVGIMLREIAALYSSADGARAQPLPPVRYTDYCDWQNGADAGRAIEAGTQYWREHLDGAPAVLNFPNGIARNAEAGEGDDTMTGRLPAPLKGAVERFAAARGCSVFTVLFAAFAVLLRRYTQSDDIVVGTPAANRSAAELESVVGYFVNPLPLRTRFSPGVSFEDVLAEVQRSLKHGLDHQFVPFEKIVSALQAERSLSFTPAFQVMFDYARGSDRNLVLADLACEPLPANPAGAKYDLTFSISEAADCFEIALNYRCELHVPAMMRRLAENYGVLLAGLMAAPSRKVAAAPLLSEAERATLDAWRQGKVAPAPSLSVVGAFTAAVERAGCATAIVYGDRAVSFAELAASAGRVADHLRTVGVGPGAVVAVMMERSPELVAAMLGVLSVGAAYLPLEPGQPRERLAHVLADAGVRQVIVDRQGAQAAHGLGDAIAVIDCARDCAMQVGTEALPAVGHNVPLDAAAYVIYTSGSTGKPKGVVIEHRALANHLQWMAREFGFTSRDRFLFHSPIGFDVSVCEIFAPLTLGATMVIATDDDHRDVTALNALLETHAVTVAQFVPSQLRAALDALDGSRLSPRLRCVFCGGESLPMSLRETMRIAAPDTVLVNAYGPTETAIDATFWRSDADREEVRHGNVAVPIGRPIANACCVVLDANREPVPIGCEGELYIGGAGLARAYLGPAELTDARFEMRAIDGAPAQRYYRSGDIVRYTEDGTLVFAGRSDTQVKLRGFRIELGEIEAAVASHAQVRDTAVVVQRLGGAARLVCFMVFAEGATNDVSAIEASLRQRLPAYMVPSAIVALTALPLTSNGKIDRKALETMPAPAVTDADPRKPNTPTEEEVAAVWREVLRMDMPMPATANLFRLGGDSLSAINIVSRVNKAFGMRLSLRDFLVEPTIERLAGAIEEQRCVAAMAASAPAAGEPAAARDEFTL